MPRGVVVAVSFDSTSEAEAHHRRLTCLSASREEDVPLSTCRICYTKAGGKGHPSFFVSGDSLDWLDSLSAETGVAGSGDWVLGCIV